MGKFILKLIKSLLPFLCIAAVLLFVFFLQKILLFIYTPILAFFDSYWFHLIIGGSIISIIFIHITDKKQDF